MTGPVADPLRDSELRDSLAVLHCVYGLPRLLRAVEWLEQTAADHPERLHVGNLLPLHRNGAARRVSRRVSGPPEPRC